MCSRPDCSGRDGLLVSGQGLCLNGECMLDHTWPLGRFHRGCLSILLLAASTSALAGAPDPYRAYADGDPRIERWRSDLSPQSVVVAHDVVVSDELFFRGKGYKAHFEGCGGRLTSMTRLPKDDTPETVFRMRFTGEGRASAVMSAADTPAPCPGNSGRWKSGRHVLPSLA